jgi:hypothetical protein
MNQKGKILSLISLFLLIFLVPDAIAQKKQDAMSSFKKRVAIFEKFFKSKPILLEKEAFDSSPTGFIFFYSRFEECGISYDIKKTDSLISPFMGYISVNYKGVVSKNCGDVKSYGDKFFSTIEAVRNNKYNESCYTEEKRPPVKFVFAYQNSKWVFKDVLDTYDNEPAPRLVTVFTGESYGYSHYVEDNKFWKALIQ